MRPGLELSLETRADGEETGSGVGLQGLGTPGCSGSLLWSLFLFWTWEQGSDLVGAGVGPLHDAWDAPVGEEG